MPHLQHPPIHSIPQSTTSPNLQHPPIYSIPQSTTVPHLQHPPIYNIPQSTASPNLQQCPIYNSAPSTTSPNLQHPPIYNIPQSTTSPNLQHPPIYNIPQSTTSPNLQHPPIYNIPQSTTSPNLQHPPIYNSAPFTHVDHSVGGDSEEGGPLSDCLGLAEEVFPGGVRGLQFPQALVEGGGVLDDEVLAGLQVLQLRLEGLQVGGIVVPRAVVGAHRASRGGVWGIGGASGHHRPVHVLFYLIIICQ